MAAHPLTSSRKRPRAFLEFSAQNFYLDFSNGVSPSFNKRREEEVTPQQEVSSLLSSSSCEEPSSISSLSAIPSTEEEIGSSFPKLDETSVPESSCASALSDTANSTTGTSPSLTLSSGDGPCLLQQCLGCAGFDQEAESCCDGNDESKVDIMGFLLHEVWEDAISDGGEAVAFNPETVFLNGGASATGCPEVGAFAECSAENGNWFLNDLEGNGGHASLNEVLDQEWMAAAVENLGRINDTLNADLCVLHLFESGHTDKNF